MKKRKLIILIAVIALITTVSVSFAIWDNSKDEQVFKMNASDEYLLIEVRQGIQEEPIVKLEIGNEAVFNFTVKVEGKTGILKFELKDLQYNGGENGTYIKVPNGIVKVTLPENTPVKKERDALNLKSTISLIGDEDSFDPHYMNRNFKYTILVTIGEVA